MFWYYDFKIINQWHKRAKQNVYFPTKHHGIIYVGMFKQRANKLNILIYYV